MFEDAGIEELAICLFVIIILIVLCYYGVGTIWG